VFEGAKGRDLDVLRLVALGERLRELRERSGLSQVQIANAASISQSALSHYENGQRDMSSVTLIRLTRALGVDVGCVVPQRTSVWQENPLRRQAAQS